MHSVWGSWIYLTKKSDYFNRLMWWLIFFELQRQIFDKWFELTGMSTTSGDAWSLVNHNQHEILLSCLPSFYYTTHFTLTQSSKTNTIKLIIHSPLRKFICLRRRCTHSPWIHPTINNGIVHRITHSQPINR